MPSPNPKHRLIAFVVAMAVLIATPLAVVATDAFTDVPESNVHHDDITWLEDAGVTLGCNPPDNTEFCPGDPVLRQQMASFMRRLAENQVVDAATAQEADHATSADEAQHAAEADVAGTAYQAIRDSSVSLDGATSTALAESVVTLSDLPAGSYAVTATWGASRSATNEARVVCHLTGGSEDVRSIQSVGGNLGYSLQNAMASTMAVSLSDGDEVNLSCHAESLDGDAPNIIDARVVAHQVMELDSTTVTE